jgi:diguanylate cyclase (GGDEF)-like protein
MRICVKSQTVKWVWNYREGNILTDSPVQKKKECPEGKKDCRFLKRLIVLEDECKRLKEMSRTDELTGFFNFRHLMEALNSEMERTRRTGLPVGLIMIDLDYFKKINDLLGHEKGNEALKWSSCLFRDNIRCIDIPCRYGGEEFTIILPGTPLKGSVNVAERLRHKLSVEPAPIDGHNGPITITASFGVDVYMGRHNKSATDFIRQTDKLLLEAKEKGRNRTCYNRGRVEVMQAEVTKDERELLGIKNRSKNE